MDNYILNNPFRILGVLSSDSMRDIERNISKFKAFARIKKKAVGDYDSIFVNLPEIDRNEENLSKTKNLVLSDKSKIMYSLFWFVNGNTFDKIALENLKKGEYKKAIEIWNKAINGKKILKSNFSSANNLSTILLIKNLLKQEGTSVNFDEIKHSIKLKYELISSSQLIDFFTIINAEKSTLTDHEIKEYFSKELVNIFKNNFSNSEISKLFEGVDQQIYQSFASSIIEEPISKISDTISLINSDLEKNHSKGLELGKKLIKLTFKDIKSLKELVGVENYEFQMISDKLANQIMQCGILYFNKTYNDQDYLSSYKYALSISFSEKTKARAKETIKHCKEEIGKNTCSNCNVKSIDRSSPRILRIYKETSRSYWNRSVQYQYIDLNLHFCKECNEKADADKNYGCASNIIGLVIGGLIAWASEGDAWFMLPIFVGLSFLVNLLFFNSNIEYNHPTLKDYKAKGWSTSQPTA